MPSEQNRPKEYDAVLGGQNLIPMNAAVLGGIAGVKSRLASPDVAVRIAALSDAPKYGDAGLDLIIGALQDESMQIKLAAYSLLKDRNDLKIKLQFSKYLPTFKFDVITVDSSGKENSHTKSFARFFPEDLGNSTLLEMVYIPGGKFMMGSPYREAGRENCENPQHQVTVASFYAGKYPITQAQWEAVMGNNLSYYKGEKHPVEQVSWNDAVEFCDKISLQTGKKYRLLSEAEWEYACRAGTTTPFHFGEIITTYLVNYSGRKASANASKGLYRGETTDVGSFPPNAFGLYDMHGNVSEWCGDKWHQNYEGAPTDGSCWESHAGRGRVVRGGYWDSFAVHSRSAYRSWNSVGSCVVGCGFRVALVFV
jgi:formylglycine-generating enzyme required for sulfatase activity